MNKQEFLQLTEEQQTEFIKHLVEERTKGYNVDVAFKAGLYKDEENDDCLFFSWEEPSGIFDECDLNYYKEHLDNLCDSFLFNVLAYVNAKNKAILCVHGFLYFNK